MPTKNGRTVPYKTHEQLKNAAQWLHSNYDVGYYLIFQIMANTGLRVSDVLSLRYDDNMRFDARELVINESKGTKQAIALAKNKVLKKALQVGLMNTNDEELRIKLQSASIHEVWDLLPQKIKNVFHEKLVEATNKAKPKKRRCPLPYYLVELLSKRKENFNTTDGGYLFSGATFQVNRNKNNVKPISRVTVWRVFSQISEGLGLEFNTACHQLRKSFALFLYYATNKDSALVVETIGWSDNKILQRYLSIDENQTTKATLALQKLI